MKFKNINSIFISSVVTLVVVFTLTFSFVFGILILNQYNLKTANNNQIIVYLNDLDDTEKEELTKSLYNIEGIDSLRYESKEVALEALSIELGVELPKNENPLNDAFYVYLNSKVKLDEVKKDLVNMSEISAIDFRTKAVESTMKFYNDLQSLSYKIIILVVLFSLVLIHNIIKFSIISNRKEIHEILNKGESTSNLKKAFFLQNVIQNIIATFISFGIYSYFKNRIVDSIQIVNPEYANTISNSLEILLVFVILVIAIAISWFINYYSMNKYYIEYSKDNPDCNVIISDDSVLLDDMGEEDEDK